MGELGRPERIEPLNPSPASLPAPDMRTNRPLAEEETPSRLAIPRQSPDRPQDQQDAARLVQPGTMARVPREDQRPAGLGCTQAIDRVAENQDRPRLEAATSAVEGRAAGHDLQAGCIEVGGKLGPGPPLDLNDRLPRSNQARGEQTLPFRPFEPDPAMPLVEQADDLGVDPDKVADLGH